MEHRSFHAIIMSNGKEAFFVSDSSMNKIGLRKV